MVEMKKGLIAIVIAFMAVCILYRQPELCNLKIDGQVYEVFLKDSHLYLKGIMPVKISREQVVDFKIYDIGGDNKDEILAITKMQNAEYGKDVVIYEAKSGNKLKLTEIYRNNISELKPWKIDACNLDNDGEADIFIGVFKDTIFYKDIRKRPFFYTWDGEKLHKKWLGSFFTDWELVDISFDDYLNTGYDVAAVLEKSDSGEYRVGIYKFIGFGFEHMKTLIVDESNAGKNIEEILMKN